jgi:hypothetical protein
VSLDGGAGANDLFFPLVNTEVFEAFTPKVTNFTTFLV